MLRFQLFCCRKKTNNCVQLDKLIFKLTISFKIQIPVKFCLPKGFVEQCLTKLSLQSQ